MNKYLKFFLILLFFITLSAFLSISFFKLPDFDFYSYHFYNGWAFVNNRFDIDFLPCQFRSYFNPILDAIMYLSVKNFNNHPLLFIIISGLKFGLLMFIAYYLYDFILDKLNNKNKISLAFCMILAIASPIILYSISFDNNDIQIAILLLLGFYFYLKNIFKNNNKYRLFNIFIASFIIGIAFGLKYTCIASLIALFFATLFIYRKIDNPVKTLINMSAGIVCGFMTSGGFWFIKLLNKFHNPLFPYFNNIFKSPMANIDSVITSDFHHLLPKNLLDFIFYPFLSSLNSFMGFEKPYFDLKISLGIITVIFLLVMFKNISDNKFINNDKKGLDILYFILVFIIIGYYSNLLIFANLRYIIIILLLIPPVVCTLIKLCTKQNYYNYAILFGTMVFLFTFFYPNMDSIWLDPINIARTEKLDFEKNSVVLCGNISSCYFAPFQDNTIQYVGFSLPDDLAQKGYYNNYFSNYKNVYFINEYSERFIEDVLNKNQNVYFAYSNLNLGKDKTDLKLYKAALSRYANTQVELKNCKIVKYSIFDIPSANNFIFVCKIK